jgi:hypothetical protein
MCHTQRNPQVQSKGLLENLLWIYALLHYICVECVKGTCTFSEGFRELQSQVEDTELLDKFNYAQTHSFEQFLQQFKK